MRSPISYYDSARAIARRCEHGVGGRLLEVYDDATGDVLVIGRITMWEPGVRLQWRSSVDDVEVDVLLRRDRHRYQRAGGRACGARRRSEHDRQLLVRAADAGLVREVVRATRHRVARDTRSLAPEPPALLPQARHRCPLARRRVRVRTAPAPRIGRGHGLDRVPRRQRCADSPHRRGRRRPSTASRTCRSCTSTTSMHTSNTPAHRARRSSKPIHQYGYRAYVAEDLEGHRWTFAQARPTMTQ